MVGEGEKKGKTHINTNKQTDTQTKTGISKTQFSDHQNKLITGECSNFVHNFFKLSEILVSQGNS